MMPTGSSSGANDRARDEIADDEKRGAEQRRRRQHEPMIGADDQPDEVRHDDADEARPARRATPPRRSPATR